MDDLAGFEDLLAAVVADGGPDAPLRICELSVRRLPVSGAAITVMSDADHQSPICASNDLAAHLDELQFRLAEGPCVEAFTEQRVVQVPDLADLTDEAAARWPVFAAAARETAARGVYVLPLTAGAVRIGVLDFYRETPGLLEPEDLAGAKRAADAAFWSVLDLFWTQTLTDDGEPTPSPVDGDPGEAQAPLERVEVYQATGMISAQLDITAGAAMARLRASAFVSDRPIHDVARDVVARRLRFTEEDR